MIPQTVQLRALLAMAAATDVVGPVRVGADPAAVVDKPAGLTVHRQRAVPLERDALPAVVWGPTKEVTRRASNNAPLNAHAARFTAQIRAEGTDAVPVPEDAIDAAFAWLVAALHVDPTFGRLVDRLQLVERSWETVVRDRVYATCDVVWEVEFTSLTKDAAQRG